MCCVLRISMSGVKLNIYDEFAQQAVAQMLIFY